MAGFEVSSPTQPLLEVRGVTVSFGGFQALRDLSLQVQPGTLRVLIGPNGAGKSTLLDTIIGKVRPTRGAVYFAGEDISALPEHEIARRGICRKFQSPGVLEGLSVAENLRLAARQDRGVWSALRRGHSSPAEAQRVAAVLSRIGLSERAGVRASELSHGEKQWLEIGMVVACEPRLLLLDEPTAGMTAQETAQTAQLIRELAGDHTVLVIDHDMAFVELLDAPVTVLHQGQVFRDGVLADLRRDPEVMEIYLGRPKEQSGPAEAVSAQLLPPLSTDAHHPSSRPQPSQPQSSQPQSSQPQPSGTGDHP